MQSNFMSGWCLSVDASLGEGDNLLSQEEDAADASQEAVADTSQNEVSAVDVFV